MSGKSQGNWSWLETGHSECCQSMNNAHHWCCVKQWNFVFITSPLLNCLMGDSSRKTNRMFFTSQLSSVYRALHHVMSLCRLTLCLYLVFLVSTFCFLYFLVSMPLWHLVTAVFSHITHSFDCFPSSCLDTAMMWTAWCLRRCRRWNQHSMSVHVVRCSVVVQQTVEWSEVLSRS